MALGERIKEQRKKCGLSQEKVAELVGVSRQAVTKWESNQSAPSTENLFKLAEIFGTTVDLLLEAKEENGSPAEQIYYLYKMEQEQLRAERNTRLKKNCTFALIMVAGYLVFYLIGRVIWCNFFEVSVIGWLITAKPSGTHSYLYGWLLSSHLFWIAMFICVIPALWGKYRFSMTTGGGFFIGFLAGMLFGPNPKGAAIGHSHYGWAIWGAIFLLSVMAGCIMEWFCKRSKK